MDTSVALNLSAVLRNRVNVNFSGKQYITVRKQPQQSALDALKEIFGYIGEKI